METTNIELKIGNIYNVSHSRKGKFQMRVDAIGDDFVSGVIVSGKAGALMEYNVAYIGDNISVRKSLATFYIP